MELNSKLIDKIIEAASGLSSNSEKSIERFNTKIHEALDVFFEEQFGDTYLYSTLLFVNNGIILQHGFLFNPRSDNYKKDSEVQKYIEQIQPNLSRKLREEDISIGISNHLINSNVNSLVFYKNTNKNENIISAIDKIKILFNLNEVNISSKKKKKIYAANTPSELYEDLLKLEFYHNFIPNKAAVIQFKNKLGVKSSTESIVPILSLYDLGCPTTQEYFVYFIKPNTKHKYYNGLINLSLTRPLKVNEIALIELILFYIFSEIARKELTIKLSEQSHLEIAHSINGDLGLALNNLNKLKNKGPKSRLLNETHELINSAFENGNNLLILDQKSRKKKPLELVYFDHGKILTYLDSSFKDNIARSESNNFERIRNRIKNKNYSVAPFKTEISYKLSLYNIINNAVKHTESDFDKIDIRLQEHKKHIYIKIYNDGLVSDDHIQSIKENFINTENFGFGLTTVAKVHNSIPGINISAKKSKKLKRTEFIIKLDKKI